MKLIKLMNSHNDFLAMVSTEFHRYLMEHENIPANAVVIFQVEGEGYFNNWHKEISVKNSEPNQPIIYVYSKKGEFIPHSNQTLERNY